MLRERPRKVRRVVVLESTLISVVLDEGWLRHVAWPAGPDQRPRGRNFRYIGETTWPRNLGLSPKDVKGSTLACENNPTTIVKCFKNCRCFRAVTACQGDTALRMGPPARSRL